MSALSATLLLLLQAFLATAMEDGGAAAGGPSALRSLPPARMRVIFAGKTLDDDGQVCLLHA
jgi:hypothetical protein